MKARLQVISCAKVHGGIGQVSSALSVQCLQEERKERRYLGKSIWLAQNYHVFQTHDADPVVCANW